MINRVGLKAGKRIERGRAEEEINRRTAEHEARQNKVAVLAK
jgi:hypothetical protein